MFYITGCIIFIASFIWSASAPHDLLIWFLEVVPALIAFLIILATYKKFPLTPLLYGLILIHCVILFIGGHYGYEFVPFTENLWGMARNNYDKIGHFAQGFVPAIVAREILLRKKIIEFPNWRNLFIVSFCLAFSAFYEMLEWWTSALIGAGADDFLATQGYEWDTQSDMFLALTGAIIALVILSKWHDRQLEKLS